MDIEIRLEVQLTAFRNNNILLCEWIGENKAIMARTSQPQRQRGSRTTGNNKKAPLIIILCLLFLVGVGVLLWKITETEGSSYSRQILDEYVENEFRKTEAEMQLEAGASIYLDFSNGMNYAYGSDNAKEILKNIVNKFNGKTLSLDFFSLADGQIAPLNGSTTDIYNRVMSSNSYSRPGAPIEKTLALIVEKNQPALLVTDYEEYNKGQVHQAAYAKDYFIKWIKSGRNIIFYKWDYAEGKKKKHLYLTVFDGQSNVLRSMVEQSISLADKGFVDRFVLGGKDFAFPMMSKYLSSTQGGNYHNSDGKDYISVVKEDGCEESYKCYAMPVASATGKSDYSPVENLYGPVCEYYPFQANWADIIKNANSMKEDVVDPYEHLLGNMYVNFKEQDGFDVSKIEARAFRVMSETDTIMMQNEPIEILDVFTAKLDDEEKINGNPCWREISLDFNSLFDGNFKSNVNQTDLFRVNVVISSAEPKFTRINSFFAWENNSSLSQSVIHTLQSSEVNPVGRVLISYYLKQVVD